MNYAQVPITPSSAAQLSIGGGTYPLIEINSTQPFLRVDQLKIKVKEKYGFYRFKEKIKKSCRRIVIDAIEDQQIKGHYNDCDCQFQIKVEAVDSQGYDLTFSFTGLEVQRVSIQLPSQSDNRYYGGGEQYSFLEYNGMKLPMLSQESGIGRGDKPISGVSRLLKIRGSKFHSHLPIPFIIEKNKHGHQSYWIQGSARSAFDFSKDQYKTLSYDGSSMRLRIQRADLLPDLLEGFTAASGRLPLLPDWAYGSWLGTQGGLKTVKQQVQAAKAAGNPITALWIQDWVGKRKTRVGWQLWWRWQADSLSYPDFKNFCQEMNEEGVKVLGYLNPFLADEGPMTAYALQNDLLVKNHQGKPYKIPTAGFPAYMLDLTNPATALWLKKIIKENMIGQGLHGWMSDYAEGLPWDAVLHSGIDAASYHNQYPVDFARLNREAIQEAGKEGEVVFFSRSGHNHSARYATSFWMADQMVNWGQNDGLPSTVTAALSGGLSGLSINHSDIGGYTTVTHPLVKNVVRSRELLCRWTEFNVFQPIFRTHEGLKPEKNVQVYSDSASIAHFAKMGRLHLALKDYFKQLNAEANEKGYPILRPVFWADPAYPKRFDPLLPVLLLGDDLLLAPVVQKKQFSRKVWLPIGKWRHAWTGKEYDGRKEISIEVPLGQPAAFIRIGSDWEDFLTKAFSSF